MNSRQKRFSLTEVHALTGVDQSTVLTFIQREWIEPIDPSRVEVDEEDLARIRLIEELRQQFGANDEAIPIILHLMDQLYCLRHHLQKAK